MKTRARGTKARLLVVLGLLITAVLVTVVLQKKQETAGDQNLRMTLVIDPGHGGIDSGAVGADGTRESDINLAIGLKLRALAELYGQDNALIRQDDSTKCDTEDYSEHRDLECRTELTLAEQNPVYISIHQNDYPTGQPSGSQVIYAAGEGSAELGSITHENLLQSLYPKSRRVAEPATKRLYILSHLDCPAILVECGFVSNPTDLENLKKPGYQTSLAAAIMGSYLQYIQNTVRI
ncbi:MAG: N-acetylmuramoyl-L-alanine amidase [Oscillospiraceae bacterium]|nr:N-acetylmuramoyl-L-alanine amidase [Oscillospiraceae bacterium]